MNSDRVKFFIPLLCSVLCATFVCGGIGDPQLKTDHPWYPGELAMSTFDRLAETQAASYERVTGRFYRRFTLPESAAADGITAKSAKGILEITIPKQPAVQARRISVEAA